MSRRGHPTFLGDCHHPTKQVKPPVKFMAWSPPLSWAMTVTMTVLSAVTRNFRVLVSGK